jgi:hypothetical protein
VIDCRSAVSGEPLPSAQPATLLWVNPIAAPVGTGLCVRGTRFGLEQGDLRIGGALAAIGAWGNDRVYATVPAGGLPHGLLLRTGFGRVSFPAFEVLSAGEAPVYAATDLSIANNYDAGARASGGFEELRAQDGQVAEITARSDGAEYLDVLFQKLQSPLTDRLVLTYTRTYLDAAGGASESLSLYNFDSASYPYGSYESIGSFPVVAGATRTDTIVITTNPERFRSYETNVFLAIGASTGVSYGRLEIDQLTVAAK